MGDARFIYGFIRGVLKLKSCPLTLEIKVAETDKDKMFEEFRARTETSRREQHQRELEDHQQEVDKDALPVLRHTEQPSEDNGWITFDKPIIYLYAGKSPYVSRDFMQFPVAHASDGLIDIAVQGITSRGKLLSSMDGAEKGISFWNDTQYYFKAHAYRVTPHDTQGNFAVDGETYPLQPFTVECHRALGALLSPTGCYAADFNIPRPTTHEQVKGTTATNEQQEDGEGDKDEKAGWRKWVPCC
ncbi:hypothetical protein M0805_006557 [Coniferiporia weirii]|nr:hypothetical protein M0805_006557 [Coniferiporia weirii]